MERKHPTADVGVIVGRFQVDDLHAGHIELLRWVTREHSKVIIVLGVPAIHGPDNPLDFQARSMMLSKHNRGYIVVPLEDKKSDAVWSRNLDILVHSLLLPKQTACLYGARDSFLGHYSGRYPSQELVGDASIDSWSGTQSRERLRLPIRGSIDWRAGVIWAAQNKWPRVDTAVDIAILNGAHNLLLGQKPDEDKFRFIGGFASPDSINFEDDAIREVCEETGLSVVNLSYVGSTVINDWRYRGGPDCIKTLLFTADVAGGTAKAADDIEAVRWVPCKAFDMNALVDTHQVLAEMLEKKGVIECIRAD